MISLPQIDTTENEIKEKKINRKTMSDSLVMSEERNMRIVTSYSEKRIFPSGKGGTPLEERDKDMQNGVPLRKDTVSDVFLKLRIVCYFCNTDWGGSGVCAYDDDSSCLLHTRIHYFSANLV